jgi:hypothetical protein
MTITRKNSRFRRPAFQQLNDGFLILLKIIQKILLTPMVRPTYHPACRIFPLSFDSFGPTAKIDQDFHESHVGALEMRRRNSSALLRSLLWPEGAGALS